MKDRRDKILDVAVEMAEKGGFDNVRQRDVAAKAGVALGTLYKRFRSKEDLLSAALAREAEKLERRYMENPPRASTAYQRLSMFFSGLTKGFCRKPNYARAVIRAMASGVPHVARNVLAYHERVTHLILTTYRGVDPVEWTPRKKTPAEPHEVELSFMLQQLWFASLVGWSAGMYTEAQVIAQITRACRLLVDALMKDEDAP